MEIIWNELTAGLLGFDEALRYIVRLIAAMVLGAVIGIQRELSGKPAGLRTHILVSMGTALFVIVCSSVQMDLDGLSRVIQGLATGIGFIGTGAILKLSDKLEVHGLTTAAGIWMTAAVGVGVGLGRIGIATLGVVFTWIVLSVLGYAEIRMEKGKQGNVGNIVD
ncbi:MAG TPA: MgtC/SapB family protein [Pyrinomonadaceae bacterium]|nr:MgtC/SapB family protein [Pyrinomonadaceae bacterium]